LKRSGINRTLGKLEEKLEAAGKIRVFAVTDSVTQAVLRPLHDYLFQLLKALPQDGTFDQSAPLTLLLKKYPGVRYYSYDLSAATDRLPVRLQAQILDLVLGLPGVGEL
jgi:hypothetical protein